jgi:hypothetical protein
MIRLIINSLNENEVINKTPSTWSVKVSETDFMARVAVKIQKYTWVSGMESDNGVTSIRNGNCVF